MSSDETRDLIDEVEALVNVDNTGEKKSAVLRKIGNAVGFASGREYIAMHEIITQRVRRPGNTYALRLSKWADSKKASMNPRQLKAFRVALATVKELREAKA